MRPQLGTQRDERLVLRTRATPQHRHVVRHVLAVAELDRLADGDLRYGELSGSATVGVAVRERLGVFAEAYGFAPRGRDRSAYVNAGTTWLLTPDLQLDARVGVGVHHAPGEHIVGFGFARFLNAALFNQQRGALRLQLAAEQLLAVRR